MNILLEEAGRLRIALDFEDLQRMNITYEQMDYNSQRTRQVLWMLLQNAGNMAGFERENGRLLIEVYPAPRDGCTIYFTRLEDNDRPKDKDRSRPPLRLKRMHHCPMVFAFEGSEEMLSAVQRLYIDGYRTVKSILYQCVGGYYLVLMPAPEKTNAARLLLGEYGRQILPTKVASAYAAEHGNHLSGPFAIRTIGRHLRPGPRRHTQ